MNQAVHAIDLLQWYLGPVTEVFGRWAKLRDGDYIDVEDTAVATLVCANGALATIQASTNYNPQFGYHVQVQGTSGAAASVWEMPEGVEGITDIWSVPGEESLVHDLARDGEPRPGFPEFHRLQLEDFVQAIQEDRDPAVTGAEAEEGAGDHPGDLRIDTHRPAGEGAARGVADRYVWASAASAAARTRQSCASARNPARWGRIVVSCPCMSCRVRMSLAK